MLIGKGRSERGMRRVKEKAFGVMEGMHGEMEGMVRWRGEGDFGQVLRYMYLLSS